MNYPAENATEFVTNSLLYKEFLAERDGEGCNAAVTRKMIPKKGYPINVGGYFHRLVRDPRSLYPELSGIFTNTLRV